MSWMDLGWWHNLKERILSFRRKRAARLLQKHVVGVVISSRSSVFDPMGILGGLIQGKDWYITFSPEQIRKDK